MTMPRDFTEVIERILDNGIEKQERKVSGGRTSKSLSMRRSRARLESMLSPAMLDASREIDRAYEELAGGFGVIINGFLPPSFTRLRGSGNAEINMDKVDSIRKRIERLKIWERDCPALLRNAVYALSQTEHTATTYAAHHNKTTMEVTLWYKEGLRVYCKLFGLD